MLINNYQRQSLPLTSMAALRSMMDLRATSAWMAASSAACTAADVMMSTDADAFIMIFSFALPLASMLATDTAPVMESIYWSIRQLRM